MSKAPAEKTVGNLIISEDVIASIARVAAEEVKGIHSLSTKPASLKNLFLSGSNKAILVNLNDDIASIDIYVILEYGAKVQEVASNIQQNVKASVQNMTGITVSRVNIIVSGIDFCNDIKF